MFSCGREAGTGRKGATVQIQDTEKQLRGVRRIRQSRSVLHEPRSPVKRRNPRENRRGGCQQKAWASITACRPPSPARAVRTPLATARPGSTPTWACSSRVHTRPWAATAGRTGRSTLLPGAAARLAAGTGPTQRRILRRARVRVRARVGACVGRAGGARTGYSTRVSGHGEAAGWAMRVGRAGARWRRWETWAGRRGP
ncbi:hypothetical protein CALCODRAFT_143848 [Calocera cornea HHB12733]|uniref:Uncharacterized protein n=1 Tax=Calocera cornea HHB12733 TaxID=1353952 RepID=A0A165I7L6_9BASI|nr:hypothetical protein CALCODRAFT_143848 [Calocera cornea HHB12733]